MITTIWHKKTKRHKCIELTIIGILLHLYFLNLLKNVNFISLNYSNYIVIAKCQSALLVDLEESWIVEGLLINNNFKYF